MGPRRSCLIFNFSYLAVLVLTASLLDRDTPLDSRLLLPIYPVTVFAALFCP